MAIDDLTKFSGTTPDKDTQTAENFDTNVQSWVDFTVGMPTEINTFIDQLSSEITTFSNNIAGATANVTIYAAGTTYAAGNQVLDPADNYRMYTSQVDDNTGNTPSSDDGTYWRLTFGNLEGSTDTTSAVSITLTEQATQVQNIIMSTADKYVNLPDATGLYKGADTYVIINDGDYRFGIKDNSGGFIASVAPHSQGRLSLLDNSTAAGTWKASYPADLIMNTLKTECNTDASNYIASCALSATELFVAWSGTGGGFCAVLTFGVTITVSNILEFDITQATYISCDKISATVVAVGYKGSDTYGYIAAITWDGTDTLTVTDTYLYKGNYAVTETNVHVITSSLVAVIYQAQTATTAAQMLSWNGTNFGSDTAENLFGSVIRYYPKTAKISGDATNAKFVLVHSGTSTTGVVQSAIITWNSVTGFAIGSDTSTVCSVNSGGYHMPVVIDSTYFMVAGMKSATSGISLNMVLCSISGTTITNKRYLFSDSHDFSYVPIGGFLFDSDTVFLFTSEKGYENYLYKIKVVGAADTKDCILQIQNKIPIGYNAGAAMTHGDAALLSGNNAAIVYRNALASNYLYAEKVEIA